MELTLDKWVAGAEHSRHGDHEIAFHEAGSGSAVVLIHGFPTCSWDWHRVWPDLTQRYRVVAADMIGFGQSAKPRAHGYSIFDQADLCEGLLRSLGVERVHILAHDYGDTVAQEMLARFSERRAEHEPGTVIESVCFLNGGLFPEAQRPLFIQRLLASPAGGLVGRLLSKRTFDRSFSKIFGPETRPSRQELAEHWSLLEHNGGRRIVHRVLRYLHERSANRERWIGALESAPVPLRFVVGLQDPVSGAAMAQRYREVVPDPDVVELPRIGHYPQLEDPMAVLENYVRFRC